MLQIWRCNNTWKTRYDDMRVTGMLLERGKKNGRLTVIDVGCSKGEALSGAKKCLTEHGIDVYAIGIDVSRNVAGSARINLDEFELGNVLDITKYDAVGDVTLCLNAMRLVSENMKSRMVRKCAEMLKPTGTLITHVDGKYQKQLNLHNTLPERVCRHGRFGRLTEMLAGTPSDTQALSKDEALLYAKMLCN